jgi:tetratricopeptide (TPR) repeat protein
MRPAVAADVRARLDADVKAAFDRASAEPSNENIIWLGRRTAYAGKFREAIDVFTGGLRLYPGEPRLLRHRGHRYITTRQLDRAIADLEAAAGAVKGKPDEVEPDGQPNARGVPTSTLHTNIWYHLALARYLKRDFIRAADDWRRCRDAGSNPDSLVSSSAWLYTALRRANRAGEAAAVLEPIHARLDVIENGSYHALLLLYKGERPEADVLGAAGEGASGTAVRYGVGAWHFSNGRRDAAMALWQRILTGADWPSFGFIAAEAELA